MKFYSLKFKFFFQFDEGKVEYDGDDTEAQIKKFIVTNSLPLVVEFNHETAQKIFGGEIKSHLILFLNKEEDNFKKVSEAARSVAKPFREQVLFVTIDANEEDHQRILEFFGEWVFHKKGGTWKDTLDK